MKLKILATILTTVLIISGMPLVQELLYNVGKPNVKEQYLTCLRTGQFEEVSKIVATTNPKDLPEVQLNQYFDGNQAAKYLCSLGSKAGDSIAYELWQKLICQAASEKQLDSALFLAESWVNSMPTLSLPKTILEKVKKVKGDLNF